MKLLTAEQTKRLLKNGAMDFTGDHVPVAKFFNPCGAATWLVSAMDPADKDTLWVVADLGADCVEMGTASLKEIASYRGRLGIGIERDLHFDPRGHTIGAFYGAGCECGTLMGGIQNVFTGRYQHRGDEAIDEPTGGTAPQP